MAYFALLQFYPPLHCSALILLSTPDNARCVTNFTFLAVHQAPVPAICLVTSVTGPVSHGHNICNMHATIKIINIGCMLQN